MEEEWLALRRSLTLQNKPPRKYIAEVKENIALWKAKMNVDCQEGDNEEFVLDVGDEVDDDDVDEEESNDEDIGMD